MARALRPRWTLYMADSAAHALAMLATIALDLIVVDVGLPGNDGFQLIRDILSQSTTVPLILISGRDDAAVRLRARSCGVRSFVAKTQAPDVIAGTIDAVLAGRTSFEPTEGIPALTPRQTEVLMLLADGHGNKEIRHRLNIAERTVRLHLTELFQALGANSRVQALIRAREMGLIA